MPSLLTAFVMLLALLGGSSLAQGSLRQPEGEVILEISGEIDNTNRATAAAFDRNMLEALGSASIVTTTPWHTGPVRFEGVPVAKLIAAVGARGKTLRATALNDYLITIPLDDLARNGAILALKRDGRYMPVREKGPLFIIYPYDSNPELKSQLHYARSIWQLRHLEVLP